MKKLTYVLMILVCGIPAKSFSQNPFESLGAKDIKVLTFSNGKYNEFFDNDSIVQIGSVLFNTKSNKIVAFVKTDTTYSEATLKPEITSKWLSPDPLAAKFPYITPYSYANDNPIIFTDPDGREIRLTINGPDNKPQIVVYNYGQKYEGKSSFVQETFSQLDYLIKNSVDDEKIVASLASAKDYVWNINEATGYGPGDIFTSGNSTWHHTRSGLITTEGGRQSPETGLLHEAGHIWIGYSQNSGQSIDQQMKNGAMFEPSIPAYGGNWEENYVIRKWENPYAESQGQAPRANHNWTGFYSAGPLSSKEESFSGTIKDNSTCIPCAQNNQGQ
jgi:hypothetical protein